MPIKQLKKGQYLTNYCPFCKLFIKMLTYFIFRNLKDNYYTFKSLFFYLIIKTETLACLTTLPLILPKKNLFTSPSPLSARTIKSKSLSSAQLQITSATLSPYSTTLFNVNSSSLKYSATSSNVFFLLSNNSLRFPSFSSSICSLDKYGSALSKLTLSNLRFATVIIVTSDFNVFAKSAVSLAAFLELSEPSTVSRILFIISLLIFIGLVYYCKDII